MDENTQKQELRKACLKMAVAMGGTSDAKLTVEAAKMFFEFIHGDENAG